MKKLFLLFCASLLTTQLVNAQTIKLPETESTKSLHDNYLEKYKRYRAIGRALLGSGIVMIVGGGIPVAAWAKQGYNGAAPITAETLFFIIGPGAALASIPFFVLAKQNKRKAELAIKGESVTFGNKIFYQSNYLALALKIQF
jgi:ABC-type transport system involved in cytochrome c biogenesis permease subunit